MKELYADLTIAIQFDSNFLFLLFLFRRSKNMYLIVT